MNKLIVADVEANGLTPTKFYVLSYLEDKIIHSLTAVEDICRFLSRTDMTLVMHNGGLWDIPHLERVLKIKIKAKIIDTLWLSWYLYPDRPRHGLESWGRDLGVEKPPIADWHNLSLEEYVHRCEEDVKINSLLWDKQSDYLSRLYGSDDVQNLPIVSYLMFKCDCAREQERSKWKLDVPYCQAAYDKLLVEQLPRIEALKAVMPTVVKQVLKNPPPKPYKKDGTLSVEGAKWQKYLFDRGLTKGHNKPIYVITGEEPPNPNSPEQLKDWLFSLGWSPETFKFIKEADGTERKIPQIKLPNSPDLCPSIVSLAEDNPDVLELEKLSIVKHRLGLLAGFLSNKDEEGFLQARVQGLTNTLRLKHAEIVNLPGVDKPYGEEIRGSLIARDGYMLVGTDMVSLEDTTKKHYMYDYDPVYVEEMSDPSFDPHLDLAIRSGVLTKSQVDGHKAGTENHNGIRKQYKIVNYSAVYGVGPPKLARALKSTTAFAKTLLLAYWDRNWAVKEVAKNCIVKVVYRQSWLYNPVSKFWYTLRAEKDRFSTLNQGTGVYCFDSWIKECRKLRGQLTAQFHDETISEVKIDRVKDLQLLQQRAMDAVNTKLRLNVVLAIDSKSGFRYSEIH